MAAAALAGALALLWLSRDPPPESALRAQLSDAEPRGEPPVDESATGDAIANPVARESLGVPPAAAGWSARDDQLDQAPPPPRSGSEKALHAAYLEQARADAEAFKKVCVELLAEGGTLAEKAAALRAWYDAKLEPRYWAFAQALAAVESESELREFALRFLGGKAPVDGAARQTLSDYLVAGSADARGRYLAVYPVLRYGGDDEVGACVELLFAEREPRVVTHAAEALRLSTARNALAILRDLRQGHPRAEVRKALAQD